MKITSSKNITSIILVCFALFGVLATNGCVGSQKIADKSGMKLWSENCQRCHIASSSNTFSHEEWKTIGMHMQSRALLTNKERDKIIEFLQN